MIARLFADHDNTITGTIASRCRLFGLWRDHGIGIKSGAFVSLLDGLDVDRSIRSWTAMRLTVCRRRVSWRQSR